MADDAEVLEWPPHYPEARLDYYFDWAPYMDIAGGETRVSVEVSSDDANLEIEPPIFSGNNMKLWISGGSGPNAGCKVEMKLTTSVGRIIPVEVTLPIKAPLD